MSLRADALAVLGAYAPGTVQQEALRQAYLDCLRDNDDALSRAGVPDHLTASVLIVSPGADRVLLALHGRAGRWFQTGGHLEAGDEGLASAALREGREESGMDDLELVGEGPALLDAHPAPCRTPGARLHLDVQFVAVSPGAAEPTVSDESLDVRWFDADALPAEADVSVRALVAAARSAVSRT